MPASGDKVDSKVRRSRQLLACKFQNPDHLAETKLPKAILKKKKPVRQSIEKLCKKAEKTAPSKSAAATSKAAMSTESISELRKRKIQRRTSPASSKKLQQIGQKLPSLASPAAIRRAKTPINESKGKKAAIGGQTGEVENPDEVVKAREMKECARSKPMKSKWQQQCSTERHPELIIEIDKHRLKLESEKPVKDEPLKEEDKCCPPEVPRTVKEQSSLKLGRGETIGKLLKVYWSRKRD